MRILLMLVALMVAAPVAAHECCCDSTGGMGRLSAETVKRLDREQFEADFKEARHEFKKWCNLAVAEPLDSPIYLMIESNCEWSSKKLENMLGNSIDAADWKRIDAEMDEALDAVFKRGR